MAKNTRRRNIRKNRKTNKKYRNKKKLFIKRNKSKKRMRTKKGGNLLRMIRNLGKNQSGDKKEVDLGKKLSGNKKEVDLGKNQSGDKEKVDLGILPVDKVIVSKDIEVKNMDGLTLSSDNFIVNKPLPGKNKKKNMSYLTTDLKYDDVETMIDRTNYIEELRQSQIRGLKNIEANTLHKLMDKFIGLIMKNENEKDVDINETIYQYNKQKMENHLPNKKESVRSDSFTDLMYKILKHFKEEKRRSLDDLLKNVSSHLLKLRYVSIVPDDTEKKANQTNIKNFIDNLLNSFEFTKYSLKPTIEKAPVYDPPSKSITVKGIGNCAFSSEDFTVCYFSDGFKEQDIKLFDIIFNNEKKEVKYVLKYSNIPEESDRKKYLQPLATENSSFDEMTDLFFMDLMHNFLGLTMKNSKGTDIYINETIYKMNKTNSSEKIKQDHNDSNSFVHYLYKKYKTSNFLEGFELSQTLTEKSGYVCIGNTSSILYTTKDNSKINIQTFIKTCLNSEYAVEASEVSAVKASEVSAVKASEVSAVKASEVSAVKASEVSEVEAE